MAHDPEDVADKLDQAREWTEGAKLACRWSEAAAGQNGMTMGCAVALIIAMIAEVAPRGRDDGYKALEELIGLARRMGDRVPVRAWVAVANRIPTEDILADAAKLVCGEGGEA